jgi:hypothetical protein
MTGARAEEDLDVEALAEAIVTFFRSLPASARREYEVLAEADRRYGEDVAKERGP